MGQEEQSKLRERQLLEEVAISNQRQQHLLVCEQQLFNEAAANAQEAQESRKQEMRAAAIAQEAQQLPSPVLPRSPDVHSAKNTSCSTTLPRTPPATQQGKRRSDLNWGRVADACSAEKSAPGQSPGGLSEWSQPHSYDAKGSELEPADDLRDTLMIQKDQLIAVMRHHEENQSAEICSLRSEVGEAEEEMEKTRQHLVERLEDLKEVRLQE